MKKPPKKPIAELSLYLNLAYSGERRHIIRTYIWNLVVCRKAVVMKLFSTGLIYPMINSLSSGSGLDAGCEKAKLLLIAAIQQPKKSMPKIYCSTDGIDTHSSNDDSRSSLIQGTDYPPNLYKLSVLMYATTIAIRLAAYVTAIASGNIDTNCNPWIY